MKQCFVIQLDSDVNFKSLVEKAVCSQHRRYTMRRVPMASPGYTVSIHMRSHDVTVMSFVQRGMQEASETLLHSVKCFEPKCNYHELNDVKTNLAEQLDCCNDKVGVV